ncbi:MAG: hypothetical protein ACKOA8_01335, partial [Deltaproteobacteria bacterium]
WGNPSVMSQKLSALGERNFAFWLHYLDLWQSIRSNFILCLTKKDLGTIEHFNTDRHPLFDLSNPKLSLFQKAKLVRYSITGAQLPSRTNESALKLSSKTMSELIWKKAEPKLETSPIDIRLHSEKWNTEFDLRLNQLIPQKHFILRQGKRILNPLYDYLFDTYTFDQSFNYLFPNSLLDLEAQIQIWENEAFPLETQNISWGLTPYGTFKVQQENILPIKESYLSAPEISFDDFALPRESKNFNQVHHFLKSFSHSSFGEFSLSELRQLWILLFSQNQFFID